MRWGEENNSEWEDVMPGLKLRASAALGSRNDLSTWEGVLPVAGAGKLESDSGG